MQPIQNQSFQLTIQFPIFMVREIQRDRGPASFPVALVGEREADRVFTLPTGCTFKIIHVRKEFQQVRGILVACKDHASTAAGREPVHHLEEEPYLILAEHTVSDLIDDNALVLKES